MHLGRDKSENSIFICLCTRFSLSLPPKYLLMKIRYILNAIEAFAPRALQENYDNAGLQVGDAANDCVGVLLTLDVTEQTVDEAKESNCNLIISHHPLLFKGIKSVTPSTETGRIITKALNYGIAIYSAHTNLDNATDGVSFRMAKMAGLENVKVLVPQKGTLAKVVAFVPEEYEKAVLNALYENGAGNIGNYDSCSYIMEGTGTFRPKEGATPFSGRKGELHHGREKRIEVIIPIWKAGKAIEAMLAAHPYEEPAYDIIPLANSDNYNGSGIIGDIEPTSLGDFLQLLKSTFGIHTIRYSGNPSSIIRRVAMCGGSGAPMASDAIAAGADVYVSGDFKYHDFTTYRGIISLADIGHYESEQCAKSILRDIIAGKFPDIPVTFSKTDINTINYI